MIITALVVLSGLVIGVGLIIYVLYLLRQLNKDTRWLEDRINSLTDENKRLTEELDLYRVKRRF